MKPNAYIKRLTKSEVYGSRQKC